MVLHGVNSKIESATHRATSGHGSINVIATTASAGGSIAAMFKVPHPMRGGRNLPEIETIIKTCDALLIRDAVRYMACRNVGAGRLAVGALIIEEHIGTIGF